MSRRDHPPGGRGDYEVGYGRPPEKTRFQPGRSGNPKGRPRKPKTVGALVDAALARRVTIQENGQPRSLTAGELIARRLAHDAIKGDARAAKLLFALRASDGDSSSESANPRDPEADKDIFDAFLKRFGVDQRKPLPPAGDKDSDPEAPHALSPAHGPNPAGEET